MMNPKKTEPEFQNSNFVGELKKRQKFFLKVHDIRSTQYGPIYIMLNRNGDCLTFFNEPGYAGGDGRNIPRLKKGDCCTVMATPKTHTVNGYDGTKQTRISRVIVQSNKGSVKKPYEIVTVDVETIRAGKSGDVFVIADNSQKVTTNDLIIVESAEETKKKKITWEEFDDMFCDLGKGKGF